MIARIWHGETSLENADHYLTFLKMRAMPDYRATPGNLGAFVLRRLDGDRAHFITLSYWASEGAIRGFAGEDIARAKYYDEDGAFLLGFEEEVQHFELYT